MRLLKERDAQLEAQSLRHEERLVELHSVIAELTRQLEVKARERIQEEEEEEVAEEEVVEEVTLKEELEQAALEMQSGTSTDILDAEAVAAGNRMMEERMRCKTKQHQPSYPDLSFLRLNGVVDDFDDNIGDEDDARLSVSPSSADASGSFHALALQEELSDAKERNLRLQARLQAKEEELEEARRGFEEAAREREELRDKIKQGQVSCY